MHIRRKVMHTVPAYDGLSRAAGLGEASLGVFPPEGTTVSPDSGRPSGATPEVCRQEMPIPGACRLASFVLLRHAGRQRNQAAIGTRASVVQRGRVDGRIR
jgi:hypothetical protein